MDTMANTTLEPPVMGELDRYLWGMSRHYRAYNRLGAHLCKLDGQSGVYFAVWAPNAARVTVMGDFNGWNRFSHPLEGPDLSTGIWTAFLPSLVEGTAYKYCVFAHSGGYSERTDPYGFWSEVRPSNASRIFDLTRYQWQDSEWMEKRKTIDFPAAPVSIYEVHLGSWMRQLDGTWMGYTALSEKLVDYVADLGFTHVELLPITEHPLDGSWGYQCTGYFSPTSRFGSPDEFRTLVDRFHQRGIGVILDWVPAHFPRDGHGLANFDGTSIYEHADPRQGYHPDWGTMIFNFGRNEVRNFLISSAIFWLDQYHIDGLRVDAVATMLYLDFSRKAGEWLPNQFGGRENLEAISFLQQMNGALKAEYPDVITFAEESTTFPRVTGPTEEGGLGFTFKWNMGWMNDTLKYFEKDPILRRWHHNQLTFGMMYQYSENFVLPYSHDEVVHLKKSMLSKMPGDEWQMRANLRAVYGYQIGYPGKKLLFQGCEFGQWTEWNEAKALDWEVLGDEKHLGLLAWTRELYRLYRAEPALWQGDNHPHGFAWLDCDDAENSLLMFLRRPNSEQMQTNDSLLFICNFTPVVRNFRVPLPWEGKWELVLCSDEVRFGGSGVLPALELVSEDYDWRGKRHSSPATLPPLGTAIFRGRPHPPSTTETEARAQSAPAPTPTPEKKRVKAGEIIL
jgi:1,4-alpha-glucan branching enzyme